MLKLGRLLRVNRIIIFLNTNKDNKIGAQLMNLILFLIIYLHFFACFLWILVREDKEWTPYYLEKDTELAIQMLYYDETTSMFSKYLVTLY